MSDEKDCCVCYSASEDELIFCASEKCEDFYTCKRCYKKWLLEAEVKTEAKCMNCENGWTEKFLYMTFGKRWIENNDNGGYRRHIKDILYAEENALIASSMTNIDSAESKYEFDEPIRKKRSQIRSLKTKITKLEYSAKRYNNQRETELYEDALKEISSMESKIEELTGQINDLNSQKRRKLQSKEKYEENGFVYKIKCQVDYCKGFIGFDYKCKVCKTLICKECNEIITEDDHNCDKEILENVKSIRSETKNCPSCSVPIYKIIGCNVMFCTHCGYTFDWHTGKKTKGHNPHADEWRRSRGIHMRELNDIPCGGIPEFNEHYLSIPQDLRISMNRVQTLIRSVDSHLTANISTKAGKTQELREKYILNHIDKKEWKKALYRCYKDEKRKIANTQILELLRLLLIERTRDFSLSLTEDVEGNIKKCESTLKEVNEVIKYINKTFEEELKYLGSNSPYKIYGYILSR